MSVYHVFVLGGWVFILALLFTASVASLAVFSVGAAVCRCCRHFAPSDGRAASRQNTGRA